MTTIRSITPRQALVLQQQGAVILDVRNTEEWATGVAPGAVCISLPSLQQSLVIAGLPEPDEPLMLICETSQRSQQAAELLRQQGYTNLALIHGGMQAWRAAGLPLEIPEIDTANLRYDRHLRLPQWGVAAQQKLADAHVLLIGAGGLGSPAALYLAAAGVGCLTIIDHDMVEISNLQRQIIHDTEAVGQPKVNSARARLQALNPLVKVAVVAERLTEENAREYIATADVVLDGSDNLTTRYLVNRICRQTATPLVYAAVFQFEGQVASFDFRQPDSPCYACLFPPAQAAEPANCAEVGVLGVVPGLAGTLQAAEVLKLLTGVGQPLVGQLLTFDLLHNRFRTLALSRDPQCPVCVMPQTPLTTEQESQ